VTETHISDTSRARVAISLIEHRVITSSGDPMVKDRVIISSGDQAIG
jgi:hypothetical protein